MYLLTHQSLFVSFKHLVTDLRFKEAAVCIRWTYIIIVTTNIDYLAQMTIDCGYKIFVLIVNNLFFVKIRREAAQVRGNLK